MLIYMSYPEIVNFFNKWEEKVFKDYCSTETVRQMLIQLCCNVLEHAVVSLNVILHHISHHCKHTAQ